MVRVNQRRCKLKGIVFREDDVIGVIDNVESFLDFQCQVKNEQAEGYRMEVDVPMSNGVRKTFTYQFDKNGKMTPSSYPGVRLWDDVLNEKLLYLHNFKREF